MSDPQCSVKIRIYNRILYETICEYARKGCFKRGDTVETGFLSSPKYPLENLSSILRSDKNDSNYEIFIIDPFRGNVYDIPEGVYDILPCLLLNLAPIFIWDNDNNDSFAAFREDLLSKKADIDKHFDQVLWEAEWLDNRYSWDGIYKWTEKFSYNRFQDKSEHTKTVYKLGLDLEADLISPEHAYDRDRIIWAIKERSKYSDFDWNSLPYDDTLIDRKGFDDTDWDLKD